MNQENQQPESQELETSSEKKSKKKKKGDKVTCFAELPKSTHRKLKVYAAVNDHSRLQDALSEIVEAHLADFKVEL